MQPFRSLTIDGQAPQQDYARDRVGGLRQTSPRKVVVHEALCAESGQQSLRHPLLQVQVNGVLRHDAGVLENHRADRRLAAPIGQLLVSLSWRAEGVDGCRPAHIGLRPPVERRKGPYTLAVFIPLALVAPLFYAIEGNIVGKWGTLGLDPIQVLFGASAMGLGVALPLALATGHFIDPRGPWGAPDAAILLSSLVHAAVYTGYVWMVGRAGAVFAAQVSYLVTAFGVLWAMAILDERFSGAVWLAMLMMFAGLFLVQPRPSAPFAPTALPDKDAT